MIKIKAKPVVNDKFWILKYGDQRVGEINADDSGVNVKISSHSIKFKTIKMVKEQTEIEFEEIHSSADSPPSSKELYGFPIDTDQIYNQVYDVKHRAPLYTKEEKSKSWYAAGHYEIKVNDQWQHYFCPKLILIQRYPYRGPFHSAGDIGSEQ